jgi:hypothetical protein
MTDDFFVGWSGRTGAPLGRFLAAVALALTLGLGALGYALAAFGDDPAEGLIGLAPGPQVAPETPEPRTVTGVLDRGPVPLLRLDPTPDRPQGETLMMVLWDKRGVSPDPALYGTRVSVDGVVFRRGDLSMLVSGAEFRAADGPVSPPPPAEPLGRWRLAGEICDGKCYAGVMSPGTGLGHRACAALCFVGDVPAVFVSAEPVMGSRFFILADADGGPPPPETRRLFGVPVLLEGALERRGSALILRADFAGARLL